MKPLFLVTLVTTILVVSLATIGVAAQNRKDLVLYYAFDEGKGNTVKDLSGNGNDGIHPWCKMGGWQILQSLGI